MNPEVNFATCIPLVITTNYIKALNKATLVLSPRKYQEIKTLLFHP